MIKVLVIEFRCFLLRKMDDQYDKSELMIFSRAMNNDDFNANVQLSDGKTIEKV